MFNFDFFELMVIGVVALVVIGPERLPTVARSAGRWVGRFQRFMNTLAEDLNKELEIDKLKEVHKQAQLELDKVNQKAIEESNRAQQVLSDAENTVNAIGDQPGQEAKKEDTADAALPAETISSEPSSQVKQATSSNQT